MGDDGQCGNDVGFCVLEEGGSDQDVIDEIVEGVIDQDYQVGVFMVMGWGMGFMCFVMIVVVVVL